jgi:hypothetical protein
MAATGERERFRDATVLETVRKLLQYHPRQWVDCSGAAYKTAARPSVLDISPLAPRG